jgi:hypothetical protein
MIKLGIIATDATEETGSIVAAEPLKSGHPGCTRARREDDRGSN